MNCVIDQSFLHSHNRHYHHYRHVHRRQVGLHLHDQSQATETMPHIHINTPKDCSEPKSMYQAFLCIFVINKSIHLGVSANQNQCTWHQKISRVQKINAPDSVWYIDFGLLIALGASILVCTYPQVHRFLDHRNT